jgi:hypothetical protein
MYRRCIRASETSESRMHAVVAELENNSQRKQLSLPLFRLYFSHVKLD